VFEITSAIGKRKMARSNTRSPPENPTGNGICGGLTLELDTLTITTAESGRIITLRGFPHCGNPVFLGFGRHPASTLLRSREACRAARRHRPCLSSWGVNRGSTPGQTGRNPAMKNPLKNHLPAATWRTIVAATMDRTARAGAAAVARVAAMFAGLTTGTVHRQTGAITADIPKVSFILTPDDLATMGTYGRHDRRDTATVRRVLRSQRANWSQRLKPVLAAAIAQHGLNPDGARIAVQAIPNNAKPTHLRITVYRQTDA